MFSLMFAYFVSQHFISWLAGRGSAVTRPGRLSCQICASLAFALERLRAGRGSAVTRPGRLPCQVCASLVFAQMAVGRSRERPFINGQSLHGPVAGVLSRAQRGCLAKSVPPHQIACCWMAGRGLARSCLHMVFEVLATLNLNGCTM